MSVENTFPEPVAVDHQKIVDFAEKRLSRGGSNGLRHMLAPRSVTELVRSEWLFSTMRLVAQLSDAEAELHGEQITEPAQRAFYFGELLAMDLADSISYELGIHKIEYRPFISEEERVAGSFAVPEFGQISDVRRAIGEAILHKGMEDFRETDTSYQALVETVQLTDGEPSADERAFPAGFGTIFPRAYRALSVVAMAHAESVAKQLFPPDSQFDRAVGRLLDGQV